MIEFWDINLRIDKCVDIVRELADESAKRISELAKIVASPTQKASHNAEMMDALLTCEIKEEIKRLESLSSQLRAMSGLH